ncbi:MAG: class C sortase [Clostridia bacterium]|nr:class C sortase [Clostridia bacterium]
MSKIINILLAVVALSGIAMLLYPTVSDQYTQYLNARRIYSYVHTTEAIAPEDYRHMLADARAYNARLVDIEIRDAFSGEAFESSDEYMSLLDPAGDGIMGVVEIPKIGVRLPIHHGTGTDVLRQGVGHMEGTSLPVGGEGTHCGMSGHRGLPSARLFTDLDQLVVGDLFYIIVLDELLVYQVDSIMVVLPHELDYLAVQPGEDLCTLVTCTPYGVNTHRLLVRGRRVALESVSGLLMLDDSVADVADWNSVLICAAPAALTGLLLMLLIRPKRRFMK